MMQDVELAKKIKESNVRLLLFLAFNVSVFYAITICFDSIAAYVPNSFEVLKLDDTDYIISVNGRAHSFVHSFLFMFIVALFLNICSSWIQLSRRFTRKLEGFPTWNYEFLSLFQKFSVFASFLNFFMLVLLLSTDSLLVLYNYLGSAALFDYLAIIVATLCLRKVMKDCREENNEEWRKAFHFFNKFSKVMLLATLGIFFFLITALIIVSNVDTAPAGSFQIAPVFADISWLCLTLLKLSMSFYIKSLVFNFLPDAEDIRAKFASEEHEGSNVEILSSTALPTQSLLPPTPLSPTITGTTQDHENPLSGVISSPEQNSARFVSPNQPTFAPGGSITPMLDESTLQHVNVKSNREQMTLAVSDEDGAFVTFDQNKKSRWQKIKAWFV